MTIQTQAFTPLEFRPQKYIPINQPPKQKTSILNLISANNLDSRVINGYFIKISNLNVPYIT